MLPEEMAQIYRDILFYDESSYEGRIVKAADRISAYIKCIEEEKAGNSEFKKRRINFEENTGYENARGGIFFSIFHPGF